MASILDHCTDAPRRDVEAGAVILTEGESTGRLYVLAAGRVAVLRGDTEVAVLSEPGSVLGEMSVLLGRPHTATVRALELSSIVVVDDAERFLKSNPEIAFEIARMLAQRLHAATTYLADVTRQYAGHDNHLGMVGAVLGALIHQQEDEFAPGPERADDPRL
jgi:CRP/FNR family transcriptional regulator, cyclic AMP receptor protein